MNKTSVKLGLFAVIGAIAGFSYYYFIGCNNGHCLISSNPYISTTYGFAAGLLMAWPSKKVKKEESTEEKS
jgi:hypothetical protein